MDSLVTYISASLAVLAISFAAISLVLHWIRRKEPPDVSQVRTELNVVRGELAELWDKFTHQQKRDRVRRLREANERKEHEVDDVPGEPDSKAMLRARLRMMQGRGAN